MVKWLLLGTLLLLLGTYAVIFHESGQAPFLSTLSVRFDELWEWIGTLKQGQGAFLGVFAGFLALLTGLLFNAYLNRRRDALNRRRDEERRQNECRSIAAALSGEVMLINRYARGNRQFLDGIVKRGTLHTGAYPYEKLDPVIYTNNASNICMLPPPICSAAVDFYAYLKKLPTNIDDKDPDTKNVILLHQVFFGTMEYLSFKLAKDLVRMIGDAKAARAGGEFQERIDQLDSALSQLPKEFTTSART